MTALLHFEEKVHRKDLARAEAFPLLMPRLLSQVLEHLGFPEMSRPESQSDPIGGSEQSSGCETQDWDSLPEFFFFKTELVPVGMAHIL